MFQLAWRWPILALVVGGLFYVFKHYTIGGIEHLHLQPRATVSSAESTVSDALDWGAGQLGISPAPQASPTYLTSSSNDGRFSEWKDRLSVAEKFNMWQDGLPASNVSNNPTNSASGVLVPAPLSMPPGYQTGVNVQNGLPLPVPATTLPPGIQPNAPSSIPLGNMTSTAGAAPAKVSIPSPEIDARILEQSKRTIRVASFNAGSLGPAKVAKPHVLEAFVGIIRQFDVVALQEIQTSRDDLLPILVDKLNQSGRKYDYLIGPRVGRVAPKAQFAIIFDAQRLETDRYQLYTVDDPEDLMNYEPLVAWFRCKEVPAKEAFTFSLINVRVDYNFVERESGILPSLIEAVQGDGRDEDDWIIAGDIAGNATNIPGSEEGGIRFAIRDLPTNVSGTHALDSIFFSAPATTEYTGRSGVLDFLRAQNLSMERALEISDHLPVWAEFSIVEGAVPGRVAPPAGKGIYQ